MSETTCLGSVEYEGETLHVYKSVYRENERDAVFVEDVNGIPYLRASINLPEYDPGPGKVVLRNHDEAQGFWRVLCDAGLVSQPLTWLGAGPVVEILGENRSCAEDIDPLVMLETAINTLYDKCVRTDDPFCLVRYRARIRTLQEMSAALMRQRHPPTDWGRKTLTEAENVLARYDL